MNVRLLAFLCLAASLIIPSGFAAEPKSKEPALVPVIEPPRECSSCSARHKARQRLKKVISEEPKAPPVIKPKDAAAAE